MMIDDGVDDDDCVQIQNFNEMNDVPYEYKWHKKTINETQKDYDDQIYRMNYTSNYSIQKNE